MEHIEITPEQIEQIKIYIRWKWYAAVARILWVWRSVVHERANWVRPIPRPRADKIMKHIGKENKFIHDINRVLQTKG